METNDKVVSYYNDIAKEYDRDRFDNSYGQFIDRREREILKSLKVGGNVLEIACGTGRLLDFADTGVDASPAMLEIAAAKHPGKRLINAMGQSIPLPDSAFNCIYSFHLMMHLDRPIIKEILNEAHRLLKPGGRLIFDIPSLSRRRLASRKPSGWHGDTALSRKDVEEMCGDDFRVSGRKGVLFLPIHRLPGSLRKFSYPIDRMLCNGPIKDYSSYIVYELVKR